MFYRLPVIQFFSYLILILMPLHKYDVFLLTYDKG